jgi:HD-GYP domain-containing protein (c-di-GMP phosphodiesterase class II)
MRVEDILPGVKMGQDVYLSKKSREPLVQAGGMFSIDMLIKLRDDLVRTLYVRDKFDTHHCQAGFVIPQGSQQAEATEAHELSVRDAVVPRIKREIFISLRDLHMAMHTRDRELGETTVQRITNLCADIVDEHMLVGKDAKIHVYTMQSPHEFLYHHSLSVAVIAAAIGQVYSMRVYDIIQLCRAALLHDCGMFISGEKQDHPTLGYNALKSWNLITEQEQQAVLCHHEKIGGGGYPRAVRGEHVPLMARIIAVADTFDAMTTPVPGMQAANAQEACRAIVSRAGTCFDMDVVRAFGRRIAY